MYFLLHLKIDLKWHSYNCIFDLFLTFFRLWHNLTEHLVKLFRDPNISEADLAALYISIKNDFAINLNPISLALIVSDLARRTTGMLNMKLLFYYNIFLTFLLYTDKHNSLKLLKETDEAIQYNERKVHEACLILHSEIADTYIFIAKRFATSDSNAFEEYIKKAKELLHSTQKKIEQEPYIDSRVSAAFYQAKARFLKLQDESNEFYKTSLLYLAYENMDAMPLSKKQFWAYDIGISALLGDRIYNFGELLGHQVIESLKGTQADWLYQLLFAFNSGDIEKFRVIEKQLTAQGESLSLNRKIGFISEKIQLMALLELLFHKLPEQRVLTFSEIKNATLSQDVELLLLKALALNLIQGTIDEVSQTIYVKWCQPRVLDRKQLTNLKGKVDAWKDRVQELNEITSSAQ